MERDADSFDSGLNGRSILDDELSLLFFNWWWSLLFMFTYTTTYIIFLML